MDGTALNKKYNLTERVEALEKGGGYVLPTATAERLGGVKVGNGLSVDESGVLSANVTPYTPPAYSTDEVNTGVKWIDGRDVYRKVILLDSPITINSNAWSADIDLTAEKLIDVKASYSVDNNVYPVGGNLASNELKILNTRSSAIIVDTIIADYVKTQVTKKKK